jgi:transcriptional regulator with XRE-family HTH domain
MTVAEKLKQIRESKGLRQKDVANALGCSVQSYSQYENGNRKPKVETLQRFADALGVSVLDLQTDGVRQKAQEFIVDDRADRFFKAERRTDAAVLEAWKDVADEELKQAIDEIFEIVDRRCRIEMFLQSQAIAENPHVGEYEDDDDPEE